LAHRVEAHGHFSQSGGARPQAAAAILVDLAEVDAETPTGTRRRLGQSLEKPWLSGAELKVRTNLISPHRAAGELAESALGALPGGPSPRIAHSAAALSRQNHRLI